MNNNKHKLYVEIMITLMLNNMVTTTALLTLDQSSDKVYRVISEAETNKHIRKSKFTHLIKGHPYKIIYYTITSAGIRFLRDNFASDYPWLDVLPNDISHLAIRGRDCGNEVIERFLRVSTSSVVAHSAGAETSPIFLSASPAPINGANTIKPVGSFDFVDADVDDDKLNGKKTLAQLISNSFAQGWYQGQNQNGQIKDNIASNGLVYFNATEIKTALSPTVTVTKSKDPSFARYTGLLASRWKSVLIYTSSSAGMSWMDRTVLKEIAAFTRFNSLFIGSNRVEPNHNCRAIILVNKARVFEHIIKDPFQLRRKKDSLGKQFSHLYIVPVTPEGVEQIKMLMLSDNDEDFNAHITNKAIKSGLYSKNNSSHSNMFPLVSTTGELLFIGTALDVIQIKYLKRMKDSYPNQKYGIICYRWQSEYYRRIFPDIAIHTLK